MNCYNTPQITVGSWPGPVWFIMMLKGICLWLSLLNHVIICRSSGGSSQNQLGPQLGVGTRYLQGLLSLSCPSSSPPISLFFHFFPQNHSLQDVGIAMETFPLDWLMSHAIYPPAPGDPRPFIHPPS